jgi:hypothetical protein
MACSITITSVVGIPVTPASTTTSAIRVTGTQSGCLPGPNGVVTHRSWGVTPQMTAQFPGRHYLFGTARPDPGRRWPSRLVATTAEDGLNIWQRKRHAALVGRKRRPPSPRHAIEQNSGRPRQRLIGCKIVPLPLTDPRSIRYPARTSRLTSASPRSIRVCRCPPRRRAHRARGRRQRRSCAHSSPAWRRRRGSPDHKGARKARRLRALAASYSASAVAGMMIT